jgi:hypothetical protein
VYGGQLLRDMLIARLIQMNARIIMGRSEMSQIRDEVLAANAAYAKAFGDKANLALPPARRFAVLTFMDARLDPAKFAGLSEGDAH